MTNSGETITDHLQHLPKGFFEDLDRRGITRPPIRGDDFERVAELEALGLPNIDPDEPTSLLLKGVVAMTAQMFDYPMAHITMDNHDKELIICAYRSENIPDKHKQTISKAWNVLKKDSTDMPFLCSMERGMSLCNYPVFERKTVVFKDLWSDPRFGFVKNLDFVRTYVGCPIRNLDGHVLATLCMFDFRRRDFNEDDTAKMEPIARLAFNTIQSWSLRKEMEKMTRERDALQLAVREGILLGKNGPPRDRATFVLTDVQGSTSLWEQDPSSMQDALEIHDEIMRKCCSKYFGYEIVTEGDAFLLAFHDAYDAIGFALEAQISLYKADWGDEILKLSEASDDGNSFRGLRVRMGIHHGPVDTQECNESGVTGRVVFTGETWNLAKSVEAMCHGGQILATAKTWHLASSFLEQLGSPQVLDLGEHVLGRGKTIHDGVISERIVQLVPGELAFDYFSARRAKGVKFDDDFSCSITQADPVFKRGNKLTNKKERKGREFPAIITEKKLSTSFHDAPCHSSRDVTILFIYTSALKDQLADSDRVLAALSALISSLIVGFGGYRCKDGMAAFWNPEDAVRFGLELMEVLRKNMCGGYAQLGRLLKVGVHSGPFTSMGPNPITGRADYYGQVVNRAARIAAAANNGEVFVGIPVAKAGVAPEPPALVHCIQPVFMGLKMLKGVKQEIGLFSFSSVDGHACDEQHCT